MYLDINKLIGYINTWPGYLNYEWHTNNTCSCEIRYFCIVFVWPNNNILLDEPKPDTWYTW